jgi:hypothetical protein
MEYRGKRVITLAMMDEVHERPDGTAKRNFNQHKQRLLPGRHYFDVTADEFRTQWPELSYRRAEGAILLTEPGYLMLVKSFQDERAWQVQETLVEGYYRGIAAGPSASNVGVSDELLKKITAEFRVVSRYNKLYDKPTAQRVAARMPAIASLLDGDMPVPAATAAAIPPVDSVTGFAAACLVRRPGSRLPGAKVHEAYVAWCARQKVPPLTQTMMGRMLADAGWAKVRQSGRTVYLDAALA